MVQILGIVLNALAEILQLFAFYIVFKSLLKQRSDIERMKADIQFLHRTRNRSSNQATDT